HWWRPSGTEVVLDLSRLLGRANHSTPTGIDRVEFVYARTLLERMPDRLSFAAVHPAGGYYGRLEIGAVRQFLSFTDARWRHRDAGRHAQVQSSVMKHMWNLRPRPVPPANGPRVYLQASPHHLEDQPLTARILRTEGACFVPLVHDVIPLTHPEFAREGGRAEHLKRMRTIDALADGVIGNSRATVDAITPHLGERAGRIVRVAHLGTEWPDHVPESAGLSLDRPYFVCVATIEPRKNHLLLLNVWRRLAETLGDRAPTLVLIGRRGWENENAIDMIERCAPLAGRVVEAADMSDRQMQAALAGARAMLLPSFAEGFGMPVAEALAAGVPVICSDIPALREVGGEVPDYLDPIDGAGWVQAVVDYLAPDSPRRAAQLKRLAHWTPATWEAHFDGVEELVDRVAALRC
ncbi:MAG TPA: glycosyltransferase family 1 protein, partial [Sphingomonas sp.]